MPVSYMAVAKRLSDKELVHRVEVLAAEARDATVDLVAHLAELDRRQLYLPLGYASLFAYCTGALRLAENVAYSSIKAARASRRFPIVLELLADGSLNLSTLKLVAPHLTAQNHREVLKEASGQSKRQVEKLVARLSPRPDASVIIRRLPAPVPAIAAPVAATAEQGALVQPSAPAPANGEASSPPPPPLTSPEPRATMTPLAPERYRLQFNVDGPTQEKLRLAQDLLRHEIPDGDPGAIFDRALTLLLEDIARKKVAATTKPGPERPTDPRSRHIPARVKRAVWLRDGGRCAFVGRKGRRCGERSRVEFHHVDAYALGGEATVDRISLRCRAHNVYESELIFGPYTAGRVGEGRATYATPRPRGSTGRMSGTHSTGPGTS